MFTGLISRTLKKLLKLFLLCIVLGGRVVREKNMTVAVGEEREKEKD